MPTTVVPVADRAELTREAALRTWNLIIDAQGRGDGYARIVLTGGGAGIGTLRDILALHQSALAQSDSFPTPVVDWNRVHVFFGDERNVAVNDPESNEGQAREALLDHVGIPEDNIHGWRFGELSLEDGVTAYEGVLAQYAPKGFDLHLLGMGHEGHMNSLFPHTDAVRETERLVLAVTDSPKPPAERGTLTLPAVAQADHVWLLIDGEAKAEAAAHVIAESPAEDWPAAGAHGRKETLVFLADNAARAGA